ncbi:MAG: branched-chain amino acid transport system II carrier protein, partial [Firmicutes bacterium]|nr:branched-chain amino acid transport system II carrier protein [Bacillota bacterium]
VFANVGLTQILKISVPVLTAIYPMAIVLMVLGFLDDFFKGNSYVYLFAMICTALVSILEALGQLGLEFGVLSFLPFYSKGLGWMIPAAVSAVAGCFYGNLRNKGRTKVPARIGDKGKH